jgi:hypothetical protein
MVADKLANDGVKTPTRRRPRANMPAQVLSRQEAALATGEDS